MSLGAAGCRRAKAAYHGEAGDIDLGLFDAFAEQRRGGPPGDADDVVVATSRFGADTPPEPPEPPGRPSTSSPSVAQTSPCTSRLPDQVARALLDFFSTVDAT